MDTSTSEAGAWPINDNFIFESACNSHRTIHLLHFAGSAHCGIQKPFYRQAVGCTDESGYKKMMHMRAQCIAEDLCFEP